MKKLKKKSFNPKFLLHIFLTVIAIATVAVLTNYFANKKTTSAVENSSCQNVIIPAYFYPSPTTLWNRAIENTPTVQMMIVDPANGPGSSVDSNYVSIISQARTKGVTTLGYVTSSYANRSTQSIKTEIDQWESMYGITDIFIDEATSDAGHIPFFQELYTYIKTKSLDSTVVINPGTTVNEGYTNVADIISIFEGNSNAYSSFQFPQWIYQYPSTRFLHLVYAVPDTATMKTVLERARLFNAGYVYVTDDVLSPGHPWDTLPSYWSEEIAEINNACQGVTTTVEATPTEIESTAIPTISPTQTSIVDSIPPSVLITNPTNGSTIRRNRDITIKATAYDDVSVKRVYFYVNGKQICSDKSIPYNCRWSVPSRRNATYSITVKATDVSSNSSSTTISVTSSR